MKLNKKEIGDKNLKLGMEFTRYAMEHPEIAEQIPEDALVVFLPEDDPALYEINKQTGERALKKGEQIVFVTIKQVRWMLEGISLQQNLSREEVVV